eukprot:1732984-Rhodomonas_salina.2
MLVDPNSFVRVVKRSVPLVSIDGYPVSLNSTGVGYVLNILPNILEYHDPVAVQPEIRPTVHETHVDYEGDALRAEDVVRIQRSNIGEHDIEVANPVFMWTDSEDERPARVNNQRKRCEEVQLGSVACRNDGKRSQLEVDYFLNGASSKANNDDHSVRQRGRRMGKTRNVVGHHRRSKLSCKNVSCIVSRGCPVDGPAELQCDVERAAEGFIHDAGTIEHGSHRRQVRRQPGSEVAVHQRGGSVKLDNESAHGWPY